MRTGVTNNHNDMESEYNYQPQSYTFQQNVTNQPQYIDIQLLNEQYYEARQSRRSRKNFLLLLLASPSVLYSLAIVSLILMDIALIIGGFYLCLKNKAPANLLVLIVSWGSSYFFSKIILKMFKVLEITIDNLQNSLLAPPPYSEEGVNVSVCTQTEANNQTSKQILERFELLRNGRIGKEKEEEEEPTLEFFPEQTVRVKLHGENGDYTFSYNGQRNPNATYTIPYLKNKVLPAIVSRLNSSKNEKQRTNCQRYIDFMTRIIEECESLTRRKNLQIAESQSGCNSYEDYKPTSNYIEGYHHATLNLLLDGFGTDIREYSKAAVLAEEKGLPMPDPQKYNLKTR